MPKLDRKKAIIIVILLVIIVISIIIGITNSRKNNMIKSVKKNDDYVINEDVEFEIKDTIQYSYRKLKFNLPKQFKKKRVGNNVYKFTIDTKDEKGSLTITTKITGYDAKKFMIDEFGFNKKDNFQDKKINKVVWLKVKKNNTYGYAIKQRRMIYGIRYNYSKSKGIAKSVPKILEQTMYFRVYYNEKKAK